MNNLVSFNFNPNIYNSLEYRTRLMGTSDCNMFIPFYSLFAHDMLAFEDNDVRILEYSLPGLPNANQVQRQYARMKGHLIRGQNPSRYSFKLRGTDHHISMHRGLLYDGEKVLMCLGIDTNYILTTPMETISDSPDITKFSLFINNDFDTDARLKNIRKKVEEMYIKPLKTQGIDVVQTCRINNWLFKNNFEAPKFKNVMQMMKHLQEEVPKTLLIE